MATRLRQYKRVFFTCVLIIVSFVRDSETEVSESGITSTGSRVVYSKHNETLGLQRTTEYPDTSTDHWIESPHVIDDEQDFMTSTSTSETYFENYSDAWSNNWEETSLSGDTQPDYNTNTTIFYLENIFKFEILEPDSHAYLWDKTKFSSRQFQESYCPYRCQDGELQNLQESSHYCTYVSCFPCICQRPECHVYGICCPDISVPYLAPPSDKVHAQNIDHISQDTDKNSNNDGSETNNDNELVNSTTPEKLGSVGSKDVETFPKLECHVRENVLYIRSCLPNVQVSNEVLRKCQSNIPENETSFDLFTLATDESTRVVYCNKFCAECNGVKQPQMWEVKVSCSNFMKVYSARSMDAFLRLALDKTSGCFTKQHSPNEQTTVSCVQDWYTSPKVDTCNVTGLWQEADEGVVTGCNSHDYLYNVVASDKFYKNIFCALCNKNSSLTFERCRDNIHGPPPDVITVSSPYSILFNLRQKSSTTQQTGREETCNRTSWASPDGSCVPAGCSPGKVLVGDNCSTAVTQITSLGYKLRLWFVPEVDNVTEVTFFIPVPPEMYALGMFIFKLTSMLSPSVDCYNLSFGVLLNTSTMESLHETNNVTSKPTPSPYRDLSNLQFSFPTPYLYWVTGYIIADKKIKRDLFEATILDKLFSQEFNVYFSNQVSMNFTPVQMWNDFDVTTYCRDIETQNTEIKCFLQQEFRDVTYKSWHFARVRDLFLNVTRILTCKYVSFPRSQYVVKTNYKTLLPSVTITLNFTTLQLTISNDSDLSKMSLEASGELNICCDFLDEQIASMPEIRKEASLIKRVQYLLTFVCMGVSMLCLLLTIVTYARFSVLRSVAGRNNLGLCLSLFLAQASLLISFFTNVLSPLCIPLGMLTHFLWLNLFAWNFLCCFYMYSVFGSKIHNSQPNSRSQNRTLVKNVVFSLLVPAIIVSAVVVGAYVTSGGSSLGYGGSVCYLNDRVLVAAATVGPVMLISLANIIFFLLTVYSIHSVTRLHTIRTSKQDDRHNLYIYVKLSSMTGAFWVTFIAAELSNLDWLRIVAIILNGLQGLFIFISFICNKRVLKLYLPARQPDINNPTRTSSASNFRAKFRQRDDHVELNYTHSLTSMGSASTGTSVCLADITLAQVDGSSGQVADETAPNK